MVSMRSCQRSATAARLIFIGLEDASAQRIHMGNYDRSAGKPPSAQSRAFSAWSTIKQAAFEGHGERYAIYCTLLGLLLPLAVWWRDGSERRVWIAGALVLVSLTGMALLIPCLADGLEYLRHLFLFNACIDLLAVGSLAALMCHPVAGKTDRDSRERDPDLLSNLA